MSAVSPSTPEISGNTPVREGGWLNLTCNATLQSEPAEYRDPYNIKYTWKPGNVIGDTNYIGPISRDHHEQSHICEAKEQGASDSLKSTSQVIISVQCVYTLLVSTK